MTIAGVELVGLVDALVGEGGLLVWVGCGLRVLRGAVAVVVDAVVGLVVGSSVGGPGMVKVVVALPDDGSGGAVQAAARTPARASEARARYDTP